MADKQVGGLSLRIGLTLAQLQSDFLTAEQTIKQGMASLNRQQNIVRLRMETDLSGLDTATEKTKIFEIREQSLMKLLEMQRDRLKLATAAFQEYAQSKNANLTQSKILETAMERERLAVAKLESEIKALQAQRISLDTSKMQESIEKITAKISNVKLKAEIDTTQLQSAGNVFDAQKVKVQALTRELELQRQKLVQLREGMQQSIKTTGVGSVQSLNLKSNVLKQIQEINQLETKLKELSNTKIGVQVRIESLQQIEKQIHEKISRLNASLESVRVKTEIDLSKLGNAASEFDKAKTHVQGLTRELELQKQKLSELQKAFSTSLSVKGLSNADTIKLHNEIQRQIQDIDKLKAKIAELNKIQPPKTNQLLSGYLNIKGNVADKLNEITTAYNNLNGATSSADSAITSVLGVIGGIPGKAALAVGALVGLPLIFKGIENSIVDMTKAAASAGDSVYVMSRGFQMSFADTAKFTTNAKVAGVEVMDLANAVRFVQRQIARGGEDSKAAEWISRYGESAYNASGNLKDLNEMTLALSRALKRAQADGKGADFIFNVFRGISADAITAIEDIEAVSAQAATIVKNGLANPALAHEVQGNLNAMGVQAGQMNAAFSSALLPVANEIIPKITERMGEMTKLIAENKDLIKGFGEVLGDVFLTVEGIADKGIRAIVSLAGGIRDIYNYRKDSLVDRYKNDDSVQTADDLMKKELARSFTPGEKAAIEANPALYKQVKASYEPIIEAIADTRKEIEKETEKLNEDLKKLPTSVAEISSAAVGRNSASTTEQIAQFEENLKSAKKVVELIQEASTIRYKMSHTDYENQKLDLLQWRQDALNAENVTAEQRVAIEELYAAKSEQIFKEAAQRAQEHWRNVSDIQYELTHSAFEKELRDIERWKEAQLEKAGVAEEVQGIIAESAAKEAQAFEREVDRMRGKLQTLEDKIFEQEHSQYENDLRKLEQERVQLYKEGLPEDRIERYYQNAKAELRKRALEGGKYIESPTGVMQRYGNGIMVFEGDQMVDDGLSTPNNGFINLFVDEEAIREQVMENLAMQKDFQPLSDAEIPNYQSALGEFQSVLEKMQTENLGGLTTVETIITPINSIERTVSQILSAMNGNKIVPHITVSPSVSINLGGAYVFDDSMKNTLTEDITREIVTQITSAVRDAIDETTNYSYGA